MRIKVLERTLRLQANVLNNFWHRYRRNRIAVVGLIIVIAYMLIGCLAPMIAPYDPYYLQEETFSPPSLEFLMGTDDLGRDVFSQVVWGTRVALMVSSGTVFLATAIGITWGAVCGYYGGIIDDVLSRIMELFMVFPRFILGIVVLAIVSPSIWNVVLVIAILAWPVTARLVRADFLSLKEKEFVEAARSLGASDRNIIFSEILPNAIPPVIVNASLLAAQAVLLESGLSFLGLGDPSAMSWGYMLANAQPFLRYSWWMVVYPGLAIMLLVLGLNLVGDGLNEALNPRLRERD